MNSKFVIRCRAVIIHDGKLLVVRHVGKEFYALPGGHLELGETPLACVRREVIEELGIEPVVGRLLYVNTFVSGGVQPLELFFEIQNAAQYLALEETHRTHAHEIEEYTWLSPNDDVGMRPTQFWDAFCEGTTLDAQPRFISG